MILWSDIWDMDPTVNQHMSAKLYLKMMDAPHWRIYDEADNADVINDMVKNFLRYHSTMSSPLSYEIHAPAPLVVISFYMKDSGMLVKGGCYKNGAVLIVDNNGKKHKILLIENATAYDRQYPNSNYYLNKEFYK